MQFTSVLQRWRWIGKHCSLQLSLHNNETTWEHTRLYPKPLSTLETLTDKAARSPMDYQWFSRDNLWAASYRNDPHENLILYLFGRIYNFNFQERHLERCINSFPNDYVIKVFSYTQTKTKHVQFLTWSSSTGSDKSRKDSWTKDTFKWIFKSPM